MQTVDLENAREKVADLLSAGERILAAATGNMRNHVSGLIILSDRNLYMIGRTLILARSVETFPLNRIGSVSVQNGILLATLRVTDGATGYSFENMQKSEARYFLEQLQSAMSNAQRQTNVGAASVSSNADLMEQLERLTQLFREGHLSSEEFSAAKRRLLQ